MKVEEEVSLEQQFLNIFEKLEEEEKSRTDIIIHSSNSLC